MAVSLAVLFTAAATLSLMSLVVPHGGDVDERTALVTSLLAYPFALLLWAAADRVPTWLVHAILAMGTVMVAIGVHSGGQGRVAGSASVFFLWVAIYAAYYFPWRGVAAHMVLVAVSYAAVLVSEHERAAPALLLGMTGTATATAAVLASLASRLRAQAATDALTGLPNRRGWELALERELARAVRRRTPLCIAILDLDRFKALNDEQGHLAGDRVLKEVAATWLALVRDSDLLARYGGDEFAVILPDCYPHVAREIARRLCEREAGSLTCSAGVAWLQEGDTAESLVDRADRALYEAKAAGGNRATVRGGDVPRNRA